MFYLYHHNDLAHLADLLAVLRSRQIGEPLAMDQILVPNAGVGRWLRIRIAEDEGIAANIWPRLPGEFIWKLLHAASGTTGSSEDFEPDRLPWHLYVALPEIAREIPAVADYLGDPVDEIKRSQLARRLADVFDQYLVYRADMLAEWEAGAIPAGGTAHWQAQVWQWLTRDENLGRHHRAHVLRAFVTNIGAGAATSADLKEKIAAHCPAQLYCFGLAALPPDHLRLLYALAETIDIHFLLPNPSQVYWGDVTAQHLPLALPNPGDQTQAMLPGEEQIETGHPLLARLGRMARDTLRLLYSDEFSGMIEPELGEPMAYTIPERDTLLHRIQADIVELDCASAPQGMADEDTSFEIHACHSPLREIQVLQDQILDRLSADDKRVAAGEIEPSGRLAPRDIVVMLPDVAKYAPAIQAVFGGAPADRYLPYGLADRTHASAHPIMACTAGLLDLPLWRWTASELLELLSVPAVMRRFGISAGELDSITRWIRKSGIRWGRNATHRAELGAGGFEQNSWRFGMDRLLLGVAQSDDETLIDDVAPWSDLEGRETIALGKLWRFEQTLSDIATGLSQPATPGQWLTRLNNLLDALVEPGLDEPEEQRAVDGLRGIFFRLETAEQATRDKPLAADRTLSWHAVRDTLRAAFKQTAERQPFLSGGITFCGMVPLRTVPFRVVCILGMNDSAFPHQDTNRAFNAMFDAPRLGDRNIRDDDRLLFLQALTSARDALHISHVGQDVHSGETLPPSPIVSETLEFVHRHYFRAHDRKTFEQRIVHRQPMQPFSARYFSQREDDRRLFTFAAGWRDATEASRAQRQVLPALVDESSAAPPEPVQAIDLETLKHFFAHPARSFFRERLKLDLEIENNQIEDEELVTLPPLEAALLRQRLFDSAVRNEMAEVPCEPGALEYARGDLPPPPLAAAGYARQAAMVNKLLPIWQAWHAKGPPGVIDIQLEDMAGLRVTGRVTGCWPDAVRRLRPGKLRTKFRLQYWIEYLAAVAAGHELDLHLAGFTPKKGKDDPIEYEGRISVEQAREELARLVRLYIEGQSRPLTYHPDMNDKYEPGQDKPFDNLAYPFKSSTPKNRQHHLLGDAYFPLLLTPGDAPLGTSERDSPFIDMLDAVGGPLNAHIKPVPSGGKNK